MEELPVRFDKLLFDQHIVPFLQRRQCRLWRVVIQEDLETVVVVAHTSFIAAGVWPPVQMYTAHEFGLSCFKTGREKPLLVKLLVQRAGTIDHTAPRSEVRLSVRALRQTVRVFGCEIQ